MDFLATSLRGGQDYRNSEGPSGETTPFAGQDFDVLQMIDCVKNGSFHHFFMDVWHAIDCEMMGFMVILGKVFCKTYCTHCH